MDFIFVYSTSICWLRIFARSFILMVSLQLRKNKKIREKSGIFRESCSPWDGYSGTVPWIVNKLIRGVLLKLFT